MHPTRLVQNRTNPVHQIPLVGDGVPDVPHLRNPFRYSGEYYDSETGFIYLRARYYDPTIGRFISEDPIRDGLNWYAYANNNPVMFVDPSGCITVDDYLQGARNLLNKKTGKNIQGFVTKDGWLFKYNTKTNEFAIGSPYETISTYFKPVDKGIYWLEQISKFSK